ncbi:hypothetical protein [Flavobacterium caeni]|uniref:Uncharacterized protein n=1 Tax=Flavobacterium caeni TaxID=490189 RepID=A0A1G5E448_9FLAO|nr:hypothetical protein [Flavobacterium caeni]SCY21491.1 hypothetical protein SAMN02927903_00927 [Flavobacterium caeni]
MKPALEHNPYVALEKDEVCIHCGKTHLHIALQNIAKIHISKRKSGYLRGLVDQLLRSHEIHHNLNIETRDHGAVKIAISPQERFFCIQLIHVLRAKLKSLN